MDEAELKKLKDFREQLETLRDEWNRDDGTYRRNRNAYPDNPLYLNAAHIVVLMRHIDKLDGYFPELSDQSTSEARANVR